MRAATVLYAQLLTQREQRRLRRMSDSAAPQAQARKKYQLTEKW